jgi:non-canonical purine NTP pyrophosphatase (RdgB/HAM1 family)
VRREFHRLALESTHDVVALEATRLVEAGYAPDFDLLATVEADRATRLARAVARGHSAADAEARLSAQGDGAPRRRAAHRILRNDGSLADLEGAADALYREAEGRARGVVAPLEPFVLVTGNAGKLAEARRLTRGQFGPDGFASVALDLPEIQSLDLEEVLTAKAEEAFRRLGRAVVVEETGLALARWNGFPGPLVRWMLESLGAEGLADQANASGGGGAGGAEATATCALLYRSCACSILAVGDTRGRLVVPPRGAHGFGWDPVFEEPSSGRTYGELTDAEKDRLGHRGKAWRAFGAKWAGAPLTET